MEALVRVACIIALPTDMEVEQAGATDAGEFLLELSAKGEPGEFASFVTARRVGCAAIPAPSPRLRIASGALHEPQPSGRTTL